MQKGQIDQKKPIQRRNIVYKKRSYHVKRICIFLKNICFFFFKFHFTNILLMEEQKYKNKKIESLCEEKKE